MNNLEQNKPVAGVLPAQVAIDFVALWSVLQLQQQAAQLLDSADFSAWPDLFTEDCLYQIQSRENFDAGLPLCLLRFESQGMLRDRVYGAQQTIFHDPYYQRHIVGMPVITAVSDQAIEAQTSFVVLRTKRDSMPEVLSLGCYIDRMQHTPQGLRFAQRLCIYDNDLIANSLVAPI